MVPKFADIAKGPNDLLNDDYTSKVSLKCKKSAGPVGVTIETSRGDMGALSSKVGTKFSYAGLSFDKAQLTATGGTVLETSLSPYPGCKLTFKGGKGADLGLEYKKGNLFTTGVFDVKNMSKFSTSACMGVGSGVNVGGNATYAPSGKMTGITAFNVGASYGSGPLFASVTSASKMSSLKVAMSYKVNSELSLATSTSHCAKNSIDLVAVGGAYKAPIGVIKAKIGGNGVISACLIKEIAPKVTLTASLEGPTNYNDPSNTAKFKYGLGIVM